MIVTNCFPTFFFLLLLCVLLYILTIREQHSLIENFFSFLAFSQTMKHRKHNKKINNYFYFVLLTKKKWGLRCQP